VHYIHFRLTNLSEFYSVVMADDFNFAKATMKDILEACHVEVKSLNPDCVHTSVPTDTPEKNSYDHFIVFKETAYHSYKCHHLEEIFREERKKMPFNEFKKVYSDHSPISCLLSLDYNSPVCFCHSFERIFITWVAK
jgi:hypothetical protein